MTWLFPGLPRRSAPGFAAGLLLLAAVLAVLVVVRWQPPLIGISALGLPMLFALYLWETGGFATPRIKALTVTAASSSAIGIAWAFATDAIWARTYDDVLSTPMTTAERVINLGAVPVVGVLAMLLPVVVVRWWRPGSRDPLHGFAIGAVAALCFTAASILTRAAPEFPNGLVVQNLPTDALAALAAIRGVAAPITAIAVGGLVGIAFWCTPAPSGHTGRRWYSVGLPLSAVSVALLAYGAQNAIDYAWISYGQIVGLYAVVAVLALVVSRVIGRRALLAGDRDDTTATSPQRLLSMLAASAAVVVALCVGLSLWLTPPPANYTCPPDCGRPPLGQPVTINPRFTPADGSFSVSYPGPGTAYETTIHTDGVTAELRAGEGGTLHLYGEPATGRTPRQIVEGLLTDEFPDAAIEYQIPNALVGYQLGYGVVADVFKAGLAGDPARQRLLVMAAVKNDVALIAAATGPYREFTPEFGSGHPSGANFLLALDMSKYVNSFTWRGDPPR